MKVLVERMEEKLSNQTGLYGSKRKESEDLQVKGPTSDGKDHSYRSRTYQSAINEVYAAMPVHQESKNGKEDQLRNLVRGNSNIYRDKETSERSNYRYDFLKQQRPYYRLLSIFKECLQKALPFKCSRRTLQNDG